MTSTDGRRALDCKRRMAAGWRALDFAPPDRPPARRRSAAAREFRGVPPKAKEEARREKIFVDFPPPPPLEHGGSIRRRRAGAPASRLRKSLIFGGHSKPRGGDRACRAEGNEGRDGGKVKKHPIGSKERADEGSELVVSVHSPVRKSECVTAEMSERSCRSFVFVALI